MDFETRREALFHPMVAFSYTAIFEPSEWKVCMQPWASNSRRPDVLRMEFGPGVKKDFDCLTYVVQRSAKRLGGWATSLERDCRGGLARFYFAKPLETSRNTQ
jgi:hypothetical protein